MQSKTLRPVLLKYLKKRKLENKFTKQLRLLLTNYRHPSLHTEVLEPKHLKIYSFRIEKKYRVIFIIKDSIVEIIDINDHYQ